MPIAQAAHALEPGSAAALPGGQAAQVEGSDAPSAAEEVPAAQGMQPADVCPGAGLYDPAAHAEQLAALTAAGRLEKRPAGHASQKLELGCAANCPGGQGVQRMEPAKGEKVPGGQGAHAVSSDVCPDAPPTNPAGQAKVQAAWPGSPV